MSKTVAIIGALDTKGQEFAFLKAEIEKHGYKTLVIDTGVLGEPFFRPDIPNQRVAEAGDSSIAELRVNNDRGAAMATMGAGAAVVAKQLYDAHQIDGIIGMGGGGGSSVISSAMRALPVGFPKVLVSTVASGDTSGYVGTSDITLMPSIVDVAGVNRISRMIYANASGAICGMVSGESSANTDDKPLIAASMFGNTTQAVNHAKSVLENAGYEVLVFHATGTGGRTMESLINNRLIAGVLDMTTTEWADEICGGVLTAGPTRLSAAAQMNIPQIVVPGCIDMCNFWGKDSIPAKYQDRLFYEWNPNITLMRTTPEETEQLGRIFAEKLNAATAFVEVFIPLEGVSEIDVQGKIFHSPEAIESFVNALKKDLRSDIPVHLVKTHINDPEFARATAQALLDMLKA